MKQRVAELVSVILQHIESEGERTPSESVMRAWLKGQGYSKNDIDAALRMIMPKLSRECRMARERRPGAVRQLSSFEMLKLSREAREALARLEIFELIEPYEREMLLERLCQCEGEVTMEDLDYLLSWVLTSTRNVESQQTIFEVFEGQEYTLH